MTKKATGFKIVAVILVIVAFAIVGIFANQARQAQMEDCERAYDGNGYLWGKNCINLTATSPEVLESLEGNESATITQISAETGIDEHTVEGTLDHLESIGEVKRVDSLWNPVSPRRWNRTLVPTYPNNTSTLDYAN